MLVNQEASFFSGDEKLSSRFVLSAENNIPQLLFLHGAGKSSKERALPLAERLAARHDISSFLFDFSGHGESTGDLSNSSLKKRVQETIDAIDFAGFEEPISVCGFSMGGHIALELLKTRNVKNIILFYSAVYATKAVEIPFGNPEFSSILRTEDSWKKSNVWESIKNFRGNLFVITGEKDSVVPPEIPKMIVANAEQAKNRKLLIIPKAPHLLLPIIYDSENLMEEICAKIHSFIRDD
jgi:pimeloyl-ACP methyl ester carboxylesterase